MTDLSEVVSLADGSFIAKHQAEIGQADHISYSAAIYTDGTYTTKVDDNTGLIHIHNLNRASYLVYLDHEQKVMLYIYENILPTMIKTVIDSLKNVRKEIVSKESDEDKESEDSISSKYLQNVDNITYGELKHDSYKRHLVLNFEGLVDINEMICDTCGGTDFNPPTLCDDGHTIEMQCSDCYTIFRLVPSRFYAIDSRTLFVRNDIMKANKNVLNKYWPPNRVIGGGKQIDVVIPARKNTSKSVNPNNNAGDEPEDLSAEFMNIDDYIKD